MYSVHVAYNVLYGVDAVDKMLTDVSAADNVMYGVNATDDVLRQCDIKYK